MMSSTCWGQSLPEPPTTPNLQKVPTPRPHTRPCFPPLPEPSPSKLLLWREGASCRHLGEDGAGVGAYPPLAQPSRTQVSLWVIIFPVPHLLRLKPTWAASIATKKTRDPQSPGNSWDGFPWCLLKLLPPFNSCRDPAGPSAHLLQEEEQGRRQVRVSQLQPLVPSPQPTNFLPFLGVVGHTYRVPSPRQALHPTSGRMKIHYAGHCRYFISFTSYNFNPWLNTKETEAQKSSQSREDPNSPNLLSLLSAFSTSPPSVAAQVLLQSFCSYHFPFPC